MDKPSIKRPTQRSKKTIQFKVPINSTLEVDDKFLKELQLFLSEKFYPYASKITGLTAKSIESFQQQAKNGSHKLGNKDMEELDWLMGYLLALCLHTSTILFVNAQKKDAKDIPVRVHFRYLTKDKKFKTLVTSFDQRGARYKLKDIDAGKPNMITKSWEVHRSLLKDKNIGHHQEGSRDHIWKNYITLTFPPFSNKSKRLPLLSMGIAVSDKSYYSTLHFLNYICLENFVSDNLEKLQSVIDIPKIIESLSV